MQGPRRSNRDRTEATRDALISAGRALFAEKGYAATSTPELVAAAGVTRGALYHHFEDKADLFRAVVERESREVAEAIEAAARPTRSARGGLKVGASAYLEAMAIPGRTRLLLVEGPAVLGMHAMQALDDAHAARTLNDGLEAAVRESGDTRLPIPALTMLLSATFDRAALAIDQGQNAAEIESAMGAIIERVVGGTRNRGRGRRPTSA